MNKETTFLLHAVDINLPLLESSVCSSCADMIFKWKNGNSMTSVSVPSILKIPNYYNSSTVTSKYASN
jgi:hypothetical protein